MELRLFSNGIDLNQNIFQWNECDFIDKLLQSSIIECHLSSYSMLSKLQNLAIQDLIEETSKRIVSDMSSSRFHMI